MFVAGVVSALVFREQIWKVFSSPERIQSAVDGWGSWAPLAFILIQVVQVIVFVIPGEIPQIAGGYLFGVVPGSFYSIVGILIGSSVNFLLARRLGVPFVRALFSERQLRSFEGIAHSARAQIAFFLLFVIPGIPKDILCYVAGLSPLRFGAFMLISTLGRMPGIVGSAAMGSAAASKEWALALILLAAASLLFVVGMVFRRKVHAFIERFALKSSPISPTERPEEPRSPGSAGEGGNADT